MTDFTTDPMTKLMTGSVTSPKIDSMADPMVGDPSTEPMTDPMIVSPTKNMILTKR